jgi:HEAT repeat protein
MFQLKYKNLLTLIFCFYLFSGFQSSSIAKTVSTKELKQQSYKTLAEAFYSDKTYNKFRMNIIDIMGKLADKSDKSYTSESYENSPVFQTVRTMLSAVTESLNKKRENVLADNAVSYEEKVEEVIEKGDAALAYMLQDALDDPDYSVQLYAASSILKVTDKTAAPVFIKLLESDKDQEKIVALIVLGNLKEKEAVPAIINLIKETKNNPKVRANAINALEKIDPEKTKEICFELLNDPDVTIIMDAAAFLVSEESPEGQEKFFELVKNPDTRKATLNYLARIVEKQQEKSHDLIDILYYNEDALTSFKALQSIEKLNDQIPVLYILEDALKGDEVSKKYEALSILSKMDSKEAEKIVTSITFDQPEYYNKAAQILVQSKNPAYEDLLKECVKRSDDTTRMIIGQYLLNNNRYTDYAKELLIDLLHNKNNELKFKSAILLVNSGNEEGVEVLKELMQSNDPSFKAKAIVSLAKNGHKEVIPMLEKSIKETGDYKKSYGAALLLYKLGKVEYEDVLIKYLSQNEISSINKEFVDKEFFKKLLDNQNAMVRLNAAKILIENGNQEYIKEINTLVNSQEFMVRAKALKVMGEYGRPKDLKEIKKLLDDDYVRVRVNAAEAILRIINRDEMKTRS